jgi:hypothetical protein
MKCMKFIAYVTCALTIIAGCSSTKPQADKPVVFGASAADATATPAPPVAATTQAPVVKENPYLKMIDQNLYTSFISTKLDPLPESVPVMVAEWGVLDGYDLIGYVELFGETTQERILIAKKYAQAFGGDVVMPKGLSQKDQLKYTGGRVAEGFLVWRKKQGNAQIKPVAESTPQPKVVEKKPDDSLLQDFGEAKVSTKLPEYPVYGKLPRLTYNILLEGKDDIKEQNYRGASYALKMYKIPDDLGFKVENNAMMAMLATRSGENKLFLVVPAERSAWIQEMINNYKVMEFVYKPLGVYKEKYPVIQFVDEMK